MKKSTAQKLAVLLAALLLFPEAGALAENPGQSAPEDSLVQEKVGGEAPLEAAPSTERVLVVPGGNSEGRTYLLEPGAVTPESPLPRDKDVIVGVPGDKDVLVGVPKDKDVLVGVPKDKDVLVGVPKDKDVLVGVPKDKDALIGVPKDKDVLLGVPAKNKEAGKGQLEGAVAAPEKGKDAATLPLGETGKDGKLHLGKDGKPVVVGRDKGVSAVEVPYVPYFGETIIVEGERASGKKLEAQAKRDGQRTQEGKQAPLEGKKAPKEKPKDVPPPLAAKDNAKPKKGQKMQIPEDAAKNRDLSFLEGCWETDDDPLYSWGAGTLTPAHRTFCFDRRGRGQRENLVEGRRYVGSASARFVNGRLYIEAGESKSADGRRITPSSLRCEGNGSRTVCRKSLSKPGNPQEVRRTVHSLYRK